MALSDISDRGNRNDCDYGPYKDQNGKIIKYDGTNIPDADIWSEGSDYDGYNRLLCLTKF